MDRSERESNSYRFPSRQEEEYKRNPLQHKGDEPMHTVRIYRLIHLSPTLCGRLKAAQMEAVQVWNRCCELHKAARTTRSTWPGQDDLQQATKGRFALHSQSVQMIAHALILFLPTHRMMRKNTSLAASGSGEEIACIAPKMDARSVLM